MKTNKYDELVKLAGELTDKRERTRALRSLKQAPKEHWESFKLKETRIENLSSQLNWHAAQHTMSVLKVMTQKNRDKSADAG